MTLAYTALAVVLAISAGALLSRWYFTRHPGGAR